MSYIGDIKELYYDSELQKSHSQIKIHYHLFGTLTGGLNLNRQCFLRHAVPKQNNKLIFSAVMHQGHNFKKRHLMQQDQSTDQKRKKLTDAIV